MEKVFPEGQRKAGRHRGMRWKRINDRILICCKAEQSALSYRNRDDGPQKQRRDAVQKQRTDAKKQDKKDKNMLDNPHNR